VAHGVELEESKWARSAEMAEAERSEAKAARGRRRKCWAVGENRESVLARPQKNVIIKSTSVKLAQVLLNL
jgi:hypothetical protein